ncbi:beta-amylase [Acrasis kona]|uniref:Beta-amylase n=1 Tax=Acrasis kona TaxID=1008807 RepID=A0AAW2Z4G6_9EUKA
MNTATITIFTLLMVYTMAAYIPVFVMMPLSTVDNQGRLNNREQIEGWLWQLKNGGTDGIMVDVWWGLVEREAPMSYDWTPYRQLTDICKKIGLKMQVVMAFHKCGTNVGDECFIELPKWIERNPDYFYTDKSGYADHEYLSLGVDEERLFPSKDNSVKRTAVDMYADFMKAFTVAFEQDLGEKNTIVTVEVGLGPAGEMRYPSYQLQDGKWSFPGVGEFQCYDKYMLQKLGAAAHKANKPEFGHGGPSNAGNYKDSNPYNLPFFNEGSDNWKSEYGRFFLTWYTNELIQHGDRILSRSQQVFKGFNVKIAAKISGIHWWYFTPSHAAELTAGYYNTWEHNGYLDIAEMFKKNDVEFQFTCLEMLDRDQHDSGSGPQELVGQTRSAAWEKGIKYSGENALPMYYNQGAYDQIIAQSYVNGRAIDGFTFLRLSGDLFNGNAWSMFCNFVYRMHNL